MARARSDPPRKTPHTRARWADLYDWRRVDRRNGSPSVVQQAYLQVRAAILSGGLSAGTKLPSSRDLAAHLNMARASVVVAYEQLLVEGYVTAVVGSGTYVSSDLPEVIDGARPSEAKWGTSLSVSADSDVERPGVPPVKSEVSLVPEPAHTDKRPFNTGRTLMDMRSIEHWRRLTLLAARNLGPSDFGYSDPLGSPALRQAVCDYLQAARAVRCTPEQVVITAGTQQATDLATRVLLRAGDEAWVEDPGYPLTRFALDALGIVTRPIPVDSQGLDVDMGTRVAPQARAAFVTPSHQYPTCVVLSMARRLSLLDWAREKKAWIVEDDYASEFRYSGRPLASLQGLDDFGRVIYVGTLNKALFPGLRLGYAVVPPPLIRPFAEMRNLTDRQPPSLNQMVAAEFMQRGYLAGHIRRMREQYRGQRDALVSALGRLAGDWLSVDVPDQGMHLVAYLRDSVSKSDIAIEQAGLSMGVVARAMSRLYVSAPPRHALMLGFSGYSPRAISSAVVRLASVLSARGNRPRNRRDDFDR